MATTMKLNSPRCMRFGPACSRAVGVGILVLSHANLPAAAERQREPSAAADALSPHARFVLGARDPDVVTLRRLLDRAGYRSSSEDTLLYDLPLLKLVRAFQVSRGLKSTGIPRLQTIAALNRVVSGHAAPTPRAAPSPKQREQEPVATPTVEHTGSVLPAATALPVAELPILDRDSLRRTEAALSRYTSMLANPELKHVPILGRNERVPQKEHPPVVRAIAARLKAEGFLASDYQVADGIDQVMRDALREWQRHYGIPPTGILGNQSRIALNVPIAVRVRQLRVAIRRMTPLIPKLQQRYVLVNAAAAQLQFVEGETALLSVPAGVGRTSRRTPEFVTGVAYVQLAPAWRAPRSIIRRDIAPQMKDPGYLERRGMRAMIGARVVSPDQFNWKSGPFPDIVQKPGSQNVLGLIRFDMSNGRPYFIHGTSRPDQLTGGSSDRFLSSGCVRIADPAPLAAFLLRSSSAGWTAERLRERIAQHNGGWEAGERIAVKPQVQAIWTYLSAWTTGDGRTHFRRDVYGRDRQVEVATATAAP